MKGRFRLDDVGAGGRKSISPSTVPKLDRIQMDSPSATSNSTGNLLTSAGPSSIRTEVSAISRRLGNTLLSQARALWRAFRSLIKSVRPVQSTRAPSSSDGRIIQRRSEEHTSELQSLMRNSYAVFCLKKKKNIK